MKRLYPNQPIAGVGAVIVCSGKILLEKRKSAPGRGKWTIPGGLVELGESAEQTVIREVKEETNLKVEQPKLIDVVNNITLDKNDRIKYHFVIILFSAVLSDNPKKARASDDAEELRWLPLDEVENYDLTKSFREFFRRNRQILEKLNSCP